MKKWMIVRNGDINEIIHEERNKVNVTTMGGIYSSISPGYDTEEELRHKSKIPDKPCKICNSPFSTTYYDPIGTILREKNICFSCHHWMEIEAKKHQYIIFNHICHKDGGKVDKSTTKGFLGYGGANWKFEMNDGRIIETNNLWCQGNIPERFYSLLPNNAKVIKDAKNI